jgi:5-methyltetrahydropteroyltriglutamate--homocysteine methyltransferase
VPAVQVIAEKLRRTVQILPPGQVWVNPDCGLKTRRYEEVLPSLRNMVAVAKEVRGKMGGEHRATRA